MKNGKITTRGLVKVKGKMYLVGEYVSTKLASDECQEMVSWLAEEGIQALMVISARAVTVAGTATDLLTGDR